MTKMHFAHEICVQKKAIAPRESVVIELPFFPPSVNNLFPTSKSGHRFTSDTYKKWQAEAGWHLASNRPARIPGPVKITVFLSERGRRETTDSDNFHKAPQDLLVKHNIIDGDGRAVVRETRQVWAGHDFDGIKILIEQAEPMQRAA